MIWWGMSHTLQKWGGCRNRIYSWIARVFPSSIRFILYFNFREWIFYQLIWSRHKRCLWCGEVYLWTCCIRSAKLYLKDCVIDLGGRVDWLVEYMCRCWFWKLYLKYRGQWFHSGLVFIQIGFNSFVKEGWIVIKTCVVVASGFNI